MVGKKTTEAPSHRNNRPGFVARKESLRFQRHQYSQGTETGSNSKDVLKDMNTSKLYIVCVVDLGKCDRISNVTNFDPRNVEVNSQRRPQSSIKNSTHGYVKAPLNDKPSDRLSGCSLEASEYNNSIRILHLGCNYHLETSKILEENASSAPKGSIVKKRSANSAIYRSFR